MIKFLLSIFIFFVSYNVYFAQINIQNSAVKWNKDIVILDHEPLGNFTAIQNSKGIIYAAINDTLTINDTIYGVKVLKSIDNGLTWLPSPITIRSSSIFNTLQLFNYKDSTYLFSVYDNKYRIINIETATTKTSRLANNWKKAVIHVGSSDNLYMLVDSAGSLYRKTSKDVGVTFFEEGKAADYISDFKSFYFKDTLLVSYIKNKRIYASVYKDNLSGIRSIGTNIRFNIDTSFSINRFLPYFFNKTIHCLYSGFSNNEHIINNSSTTDFGSTFQTVTLTKDIQKDIEAVVLKNDIPEVVLSINSSDNNHKNIILNDVTVNNYPSSKSYIFPIVSKNSFGLLYVGMDIHNKLFFTTEPTLSSTSYESSVTNSFYLSQNYPNPFNPSTIIKFYLPSDTHVKLSVFDVLGNEIDVLTNDYLYSGYHTIKFNSKNLSSGIYFYKLLTNEFVDTKKMLLTK